MNNLLSELLQIDKQRIERERVVLQTIWERLKNKIKLTMKSGYKVCIYTIPEFLVGYPPPNIPKTMNYLLNRLEQEGLIYTQLDELNIFIGWDPIKIKELNNMHSEKVKNMIDHYDNELADVLVNYKI